MTTMPLRHNAGPERRIRASDLNFIKAQSSPMRRRISGIGGRQNIRKPEKVLRQFSIDLDRVAIMPQTVEETRALRVSALKKCGVLRPGVAQQWGWDNPPTRTVTLRCGVDEIDLVFTAAGDVVHQRVPLVRTPCHFGGDRLWFQCSCGRRTTGLFDAETAFACRVCLGLTYSIQQEAPRWRPLRGAQAIRRRLGGSASIIEPLPPRPSGMHQRTYNRLADKAQRYEEQTIGQLAAWRASVKF